ncbi:MAG: FG-GAP repeat protein [Chitinophagaceae bacterium]|nr:FG-GAP repeat protein [Chitinophagaceae bacterium]
MKWAPVYIKSDGQTDPIELPASDGSDNDQFGYAVAISGDYAVAGAYMDDVGANADQDHLYFHRVNGVWTEEAHVTASDGAAGDGFGFSVSISRGLCNCRIPPMMMFLC